LTVPSGKFDEGAFIDVTSIQKFWCKMDNSTAILADGMDESIRYDVTIGDAYGLQAVLMRDEKPVKGRERYLFYLGRCFSQLGDYDRSLKCYDRSKGLDPTNPAPWFNRARPLTALNRIKDAQDSLQQAKKLFKKQGNQSGMAIALHELGTVAMSKGDHPEAIKLYNESLEISQAISFQLQISFSLHHLGMVNQVLHRYPEAREFYKQSLEIKRKLGARPEMAVTLVNLATIELDESNLDEAESLYEESLDILKESGDLVGIANALYQLYKVEYRKGNISEAKRLYDESMEIKRRLGIPRGN
jgi:tetratricopeptide (TPR) repeat protein